MNKLKMNTSHTPGPWTISKDGSDVENAEGAGVCAIYADETAEANARLIAAAPDLLACLQDIVREPQGKTQADNAAVLASIIRQARAAIARATQPTE